MLRITLALLALSTAALANPTTEGARGRETDPPRQADPPQLLVSKASAQVKVGTQWKSFDVRELCGVQAPGARVRIEEVSGPRAASAAHVAIDGPTRLRVRAGDRSEAFVVELSATDANGNQAFDRCIVRVR